MERSEDRLSFRLSERCVRHWIKTYLTDGFDALADKPHVGQSSVLTPLLVAALREQIGRADRTWTAQQLADWLFEQHGVRLGADWLGRLLLRAKLSYKPTSRPLRHKQAPEEVAAKSADLVTLEKGALPDC